MSQAGIVDFIGTHPQLPTMFVTDSGTAIPIANTIEILGVLVSAGLHPIETTGSGNTINIQVQVASAHATPNVLQVGLASFNSAQFTVDANGFVSVSGGVFSEDFMVDTFTAPGTNPVIPNGSGTITVTGGQVAAGTTTNVIRTDSLAANTYTIQIQRSQAVASSTIGDNGVSHFSSNQFAVDANGFVTLLGGGQAIDSIAVDTGTSPIVPTIAGLVTISGATVSAGTNPVRTDGTGTSTMAVEVQVSQAIAAANVLNVGLAAFNSTFFTVDASGFVSINGAHVGQTITGNSGGALSPTAGNWNILGTGSLTSVGSVSTLTMQLTGLTNHAVQVGAGTATLTQVGPSATTGAVLASNGAAADPSFQTISSLGAITTITGNSGGAESPSSGNFNILGTGSITVAGSANTETVQLTGLTNHNVLVGAGTATITNVAPSATSGVPLISNGAAADPSFGTAVVAGGGTGDTSFTAYAVICGGTTSTGALQSVASVGTTGQILVSNGAGALPTFQTVSATGAFDKVVVQVFTTTGSGTYTPSTGMKYATIEVIGGGAGGGGVANQGGTSAAAAGGGGAGGYAKITVTAATIGASKTLTVGTGGAGGVAGANTGTGGGTTSVGSTIVQATGGAGGTGAANSTSSINFGGAGGVGSSGDFNVTGQTGGNGFSVFVAGVGALNNSGQGGSSIYGSGGLSAGSESASVAGNNASNYGSGGSGAAGPNTGTQQAGGNGSQGIIIITEYVSS